NCSILSTPTLPMVAMMWRRLQVVRLGQSGVTLMAEGPIMLLLVPLCSLLQTCVLTVLVLGAVRTMKTRHMSLAILTKRTLSASISLYYNRQERESGRSIISERMIYAIMRR